MSTIAELEHELDAMKAEVTELESERDVCKNRISEINGRIAALRGEKGGASKNGAARKFHKNGNGATTVSGPLRNFVVAALKRGAMTKEVLTACVLDLGYETNSVNVWSVIYQCIKKDLSKRVKYDGGLYKLVR